MRHFRIEQEKLERARHIISQFIARSGPTTVHYVVHETFEYPYHHQRSLKLIYKLKLNIQLLKTD